MPSATNAYMSQHVAAAANRNIGSVVSSVASSQSQALANEECGIREVWSHNLEEEFRKIRRIVQEYPYVAMDTEFPGIVAKPNGIFKSMSDWNYHSLYMNINMLKLIQCGLTFFNKNGQTPSPISTWQFNFKYILDKEMYSQDSIDLLIQSGIQFSKMEKDGIEIFDFAAHLFSSGLLLNDDIYWIAFHSGYDFAYLLRAIINRNLKIDSDDFYENLRKYFPNIWDLKYLARGIRQLKGGLQDLADALQISRRGPQHQAGSDSLLTGDVYFRVSQDFYENNCPTVHIGIVYGLLDEADDECLQDDHLIEPVLNPDDVAPAISTKSLINGHNPHW